MIILRLSTDIGMCCRLEFIDQFNQINGRLPDTVFRSGTARALSSRSGTKFVITSCLLIKYQRCGSSLAETLYPADCFFINRSNSNLPRELLRFRIVHAVGIDNDTLDLLLLERSVIPVRSGHSDVIYDVHALDNLSKCGI